MGIPFNTLIRPVLEFLTKEYKIAGGAPAEAEVVAIGLQESLFEARDQIVTGKPAGVVGPATGYWQFEKSGGVRGVMRHPASRDIALACAQVAGVSWDEDAIWRLFTRPEGDELACVFARLLLLTDPQALPAPTPANEEVAWQYYLRNWRPGKPHRDKWGANWRQGIAAATSGNAPVDPPTVFHPAPGPNDERFDALIRDVEAALAKYR